MSNVNFAQIHAHNAKMEKLKQARIRMVFDLLKIHGVANPVSTAQLSSYEDFDYSKFAKSLSERYGYEIKKDQLAGLTVEGVVDLIGRHQLEDRMKDEIAQQEDEELERMLEEENEIAENMTKEEEAPVAPEDIQQPAIPESTVPPVSESIENDDTEVKDEDSNESDKEDAK
jgi:hypothetical protein